MNERGEPVRGEVGELVIRQPYLGMTMGVWNDPQRYLDTYWARWPNVWVHGDWALIDKDALWYILGRSDDTIKVAGKRLGPAEVEAILTGHPAVSEAAAIGGDRGRQAVLDHGALARADQVDAFDAVLALRALVRVVEDLAVGRPGGVPHGCELFVVGEHQSLAGAIAVDHI